MPQTAARAMKFLRLPIAGGRQAIFGKRGCRILSVTRPFAGHVPELGWLSRRLSPALPVAAWYLRAGSGTWPTRSSQAAAASKMPRLVPSPRLAE